MVLFGLVATVIGGGLHNKSRGFRFYYRASSGVYSPLQLERHASRKKRGSAGRQRC